MLPVLFSGSRTFTLASHALLRHVTSLQRGAHLAVVTRTALRQTGARRTSTALDSNLALSIFPQTMMCPSFCRPMRRTLTRLYAPQLDRSPDGQDPPQRERTPGTDQRQQDKRPNAKGGGKGSGKGGGKGRTDPNDLLRAAAATRREAEIFAQAQEERRLRDEAQAELARATAEPIATAVSASQEHDFEQAMAQQADQIEEGIAAMEAEETNELPPNALNFGTAGFEELKYRQARRTALLLPPRHASGRATRDRPAPRARWVRRRHHRHSRCAPAHH